MEKGRSKRKLPDTSREKKNATIEKDRKLNPIFTGLKFLLLPGFGSDFLTSRAEILLKQIESRGGVGKMHRPSGHKRRDVTTYRSDEFDLIIVSRDCTQEYLSGLGISAPNNKIVNPEWATTSIKTQQISPAQSFLWSSSTSQPSTETVKGLKESDSIIEKPSEEIIAAVGPQKLGIREQMKTGSAFKNSTPNLNQHITSILGRLEEIYSAVGDKWREYAYRKAGEILKRLKIPVLTEDDVDKIDEADIRGLGAKMIAKIKEIVVTGSLEKLLALEQDEKIGIICKFCHVWGAGPTTALKWYSAGYRSLGDLQSTGVLNSQQQIGVRYFDELSVRIPREEVEQLSQKVREAFERAITANYGGAVHDSRAHSLYIETCGSFRRLAQVVVMWI